MVFLVLIILILLIAVILDVRDHAKKLKLNVKLTTDIIKLKWYRMK